MAVGEPNRGAGPDRKGCGLYEVDPVGKWITGSDRLQFQTDGYMVIRQVVPLCIIEQAVRDITAFVGADLANPRTWYQGAPELDGIVPMHHAQGLWDIRQCPSLYEVFAEFHGQPELMVDINRCIFCPPGHPDFPTVSRGNIHWDIDPRKRGPALIQGVVLLSDVDPGGGGFQCLPSIYRNLDSWLTKNAHERNFDFVRPGLNDCETAQVVGKAGDVILWSVRLPHGTALNRSEWPRIAMFVSMQDPSAFTKPHLPSLADAEGLRAAMRTWWRTKRAPDYWRGLPGQLDPEPGPPAELSELGLRLIGALPW